MRRSVLVLAALGVLVVGAAAGCGDDKSPSAATASTVKKLDVVTISVGESTLGPIITGDGDTLYLLTNDTADASTCTGGCAKTWPPVTGAGKFGPGTDAAAIGSIASSDGTRQVTYYGHPMYRFTGDETPGDTNGQGSGGTWFVVDAMGNPVGAPVAATTSTAVSTGGAGY